MFNQDFNELLSLFNGHNVKYLAVGGYAAGFHAQPRATKDLGLFIQPDAGSGAAVYAALAEFGASLKGLAPDDFVERGSFFGMGRAPLMVELFPKIKGIEFDRAWGRRVETTVDTKTELEAFFISRDGLLAAKLAAGRPQDLAVIEAIRKAVKSQAPPSATNKPSEPT